MSVAVDKFKYRLPYKMLFGGASAIRSDQFRFMRHESFSDNMNFSHTTPISLRQHKSLSDKTISN